MTTEPETYIISARPLAVFIGQCEQCPRPVRTSSDTFIGDHYPYSCPDCRKPVTLARLYGVVSKMDCHDACMGAYGPNCECGCGGVNHGNIWERPGEMLADALRIYREDRERRQAAAQKAKKTRTAKKEEQRRLEFCGWLRDHTILVTELTATDWLTDPFPNDFLSVMREIVERGKILTDPQAERTAQILTRRREVRERIAAEQAERAQREANATEVPERRMKVTGTIVNAWHTDGDWGPMIKIKIDCGTYEVRGTCPKSLVSDALHLEWGARDYDNLPRQLVGKRVTLTATLRPDPDEHGQGWFSRPTKASFMPII